MVYSSEDDDFYPGLPRAEPRRADLNGYIEKQVKLMHGARIAANRYNAANKILKQTQNTMSFSDAELPIINRDIDNKYTNPVMREKSEDEVYSILWKVVQYARESKQNFYHVNNCVNNHLAISMEQRKMNEETYMRILEAPIDDLADSFAYASKNNLLGMVGING